MHGLRRLGDPVQYALAFFEPTVEGQLQAIYMLAIGLTSVKFALWCQKQWVDSIERKRSKKPLFTEVR